MLAQFFGTLRRTPDEVSSQDVFSYAHGVGLSGGKPSAVTIGARMAAVSSYFKFLIRMGMVAVNPADALERPKVAPAPPRGLSADDVQKLLGVVPDTIPGRRDRAIILTLVLTGRRRQEVIDLKASDITLDDGRPFYRYRGKGGRRGRRELPGPAHAAVKATLADVGKTIETMGADESLWQAGTSGTGVSSATFYNRFRSYLVKAGLPLSGAHILRRSAAKLRRDAGESIETVSQFLDHSSLQVTTTYLRRLEGQQDRGWKSVAAAIGVTETLA